MDAPSNVYYVMNNTKPKSTKRYMAVPVDKNKPIVYFGHKNYENYTMHKDSKRLQNYLKRHSREDWTDLTRPGTWSRYILWNKKTLEESANYMSKLFNIDVKLNLSNRD